MYFEDERAPSHSPIFRNPKQYVDAKLKIYEDPHGFAIVATPEEKEHLYTLKTQTAIENAFKSMLDRRWDN